MTCGDNIAASRRIGYAVEVSEGEAEPTGDITSPGNSAKDFRFMLLRCGGNVLDHSVPSVLRIWGIEYLARKVRDGGLNGEHAQICDLIQRLSATNVAS
jgi:hypothetical protein